MFFPGLVVYYAAESQGLEPTQGGQESTHVYIGSRIYSLYGGIGYPAPGHSRVGT